MTLGAAGSGSYELSAGAVLDGRYRLGHRLGRGGFGDVWRAEELLPGGGAYREVALKVLTAGVSDESFWSEEAKLLASFRHPSLVTIYAAGILTIGPDPTAAPIVAPFVAMELLTGSTLADRLKVDGPVPWRRVLLWARDVAAALDVIHSRGVVHLDLKPANLFVTDEGALKVLDFGIARRAGSPGLVLEGRVIARRQTLVDPELGTAEFVAEQEAYAATRPASDDHTTERAVVGTPGFMAPEVFERGELSAATDAYALAVCFVQLATGSLPYGTADEPSEWNDPSAVSAWWAEIRRATLSGELRDLAADPARLPPGVVALLRRLLAVDPAARGAEPGRLFALFDEAWTRPYGPPTPLYFGGAELPPEAEGWLFGRDDDIARLGRDLDLDSSLVLQGARRSGKTSLLVAGLVPYLARSAADGKDDWVSVRIGPSKGAHRTLDDALAEVSPELRSASPEEVFSWCAQSKKGLAIVVDPFDEALVGRGGERIESLFSRVCEARHVPGLRLLGALREDRSAELFDQPIGASLRASLRFVSSPATTAAEDIAFGPARHAGATVEGKDAVIAEVTRELRADPSRLVFVALALRELWDARVSDGGAPALRGATFRAKSGVSGAVGRYGDRVMADLDVRDRVIAEDMLLRLSTTEGSPVAWEEEELLENMGAGVEPVSKARPRGAPLSRDARGTRRAVVTSVLEALDRADLIQRAAGHVEIAHPALLTDWARLVSARLNKMDRIVFRDSLREAVLAWERAGGRRDLLWRGSILREALLEPDVRLGRLSPKERIFIERSTRYERIRTATSLGAIALFGALLVFAFVAKRAYDARQLAAEDSRRAAEAQAYVAEVVARSRRDGDPFTRVAWIEEAMKRGSRDGMLALDLASVAPNLPRARFLSLDPITAASFPWSDRFLIGKRSGRTLAVVDLKPNDPDVVEGVALDFDPEKDRLPTARDPRSLSVRPHADAIAEVIPFAFDTSLVTRSVAGEVRVLRLKKDGTVALAATAPLRCAGAIHVAEAAPVVACSTDAGLARWDLRRHREGPAESVDTFAFQGAVLSISPDGEHVAAAVGKRVTIWSAKQGREATFVTEEPVVLARFSPRDPVVALIEPGRFEVIDVTDPRGPRLRAPSEDAPADARWDESGLALAICAASGAGQLYSMLRDGGGLPEATPNPCDPPPKKDRPEVVTATTPLGALGDRDLSAHPLIGGYRLPDGRFLSHDLVLFASGDAPSAKRLRFEGKTPAGAQEPYSERDSMVAVVRDGNEVAIQLGDEVRIYRADTGQRVQSRRGRLLRRCDDGRVIAWITESPEAFSVIDVRTGSVLGGAKREPGFVVGVDGACSRLVTQTLDGTLMAAPLSGEIVASSPVAHADGYVYDVKESPARGGLSSGLLLALSSGAIARMDDRTGDIWLAGYATPRATALGDGPNPGEIAYADAAGVVVLRPNGESVRVLSASGGALWQDLSVAPDGATMLLTSATGISVLDVGSKEIVGSLKTEGFGRFAPWDAERASVLAYSFDRIGGATGLVIPRALPLAEAIATSLSNVRVDQGKLRLGK